MRIAIAVMVVLAVVTCSSASAAPVPPPNTELVSVSTAGAQVDNYAVTEAGGISQHGRYVTFDTAATTLVAGDTNGLQDVFVRDRGAGTTERASVSSAGAQANGVSANGAISATGRYVVFSSGATNLVPGPDHNNNNSDIFRRDRVTGRTVAVSITPRGRLSDSGAQEPSISADGRYIAFSSSSTNLARDPNRSGEDVFVRDMATGTTRIASFRGVGRAADRGSFEPAISADGTAVVFASDATNLVHHDTNGSEDIFERDLVGSTTTRVSVSSTGVQAKSGSFSFDPSTSADGRYVIFTSSAPNLAVDDHNRNSDVFVHNMATGTTELVSRSSSGIVGDGRSVAGSISNDGRFVVFWSGADNLVAGDGNLVADVFMRDLVTGTTTRVDVSSAGAEADSDPFNQVPAISGDGLHIAFDSFATNLVDGDTNGLPDVFIRNLG